MLIIGAHLSISKGFEHIAQEALSIGANTFQFFTRNPRGGKAKDLDSNDLIQFRSTCQKHDIPICLAHAPYTINPAAENPQTRSFAEQTLKEDLSRMEQISKNQLYNFHPGSHVGQGIEQGISLITEILNRIIKPEQTTTLLLETMSGKGSEIGSRFEEIQEIINRIQIPEHIGVCLDTCHVYSAGYDIVSNLEAVLEEFDKIIGLNRLKAIHLNDSLTPFNSHKDRHAKIGEGSIGADALLHLVSHPLLKNIPFYLETPNDLQGWAQEIAFFREKTQ